MGVFDLQGRQVRTAKLPKGKGISQRFDLVGLPSGQYFARIISGGRVGTKRFIKQ
ncbi:MAG: T9SS type A sorting domain-containing protein [Saprospiraceae bacterium]|nr:T9SS type A sorting domain-containing protein [Saprospiraceae bacterium]